MLAITAFQKEVKSHNITPPPRCGLEFSNVYRLYHEKSSLPERFLMLILLSLCSFWKGK